MVVLVAWLSIIGPGVVNLLPHPSLVRVDWRLAVVTESNVIYDHSFLSLLVSLLSSRPPQGVARVVQPSLRPVFVYRSHGPMGSKNRQVLLATAPSAKVAMMLQQRAAALRLPQPQQRI